MNTSLILGWMAAFVAAQIALFVAAGRARNVVAPRTPKSLAVVILRWSLGVMGLLVLFAVLIPTPHGRNWESAVLGELRTFSSAQVAYQSLTGGWFGAPECLARPATCVPEYSGSPFYELTPERKASLGYTLTFHPGREVMSKTGVKGYESWAYVAVPEPRARNFRSFCLDASGAIRWAGPRETITITAGVCPPTMAMIN
jgi:hypothetical protein